MKREGRQHGMVRSFCPIPSPLNPNSQRRIINKFDTPTTAGLFVKVAAKPTNHSKFTGRCGKPKCSECHAQPACKSKDKAKGSQKLKSTTDVSTDCKFMSWQLVDQTTNGTKKSFDYSATAILDRLANNHDDYSDYDDDDEYDEDAWSFRSNEDDYYGDGNVVEYDVDVGIKSDAEKIISNLAKTIMEIMDDQNDLFFLEHLNMLL